MPDTTLELEYFEFRMGQHSSKEMGSLRGQNFNERLAHRGVLFERLVVFFCFPPFLVNRGELGVVQVGVAADQIQDTPAAVLVCKDLSGSKDRLLIGEQIDASGLPIGKISACTA